MPRPTPNPDEQHDDFIERCMLNPVMKDEIEVLPQRANACEAIWKKEMSMADLKTETIKGVEVVRVGVWHGAGCPPDGCKITTQQLDNMVEASKAIGDAMQFPVKLGHDEKQKIIQKDGLPAAGWLTNLRRKADVLIADFAEVPGKIADLIRAGAYKQRSAEIRENMEIDGKTYKHVLTGLALLGADIPAVAGLDDIKAMYEREELEYDEGTHYSIYAEDKFDADEVDALIDGLMTRIAPMIKGRVGAPTLRQLGRALKEGIRRAVSGKRLSDTDDDIQEILSASGDEQSKRLTLTMLLEVTRKSGDEDGASAIKEAIMAFDEKALRTELGVSDDADLLDAVKAAKANGASPDLSARLDDVEKQLTTSQQEVLKLQTDNARSEAEAFVTKAVRDLKVLPAQSEHIILQYLHDADATVKFVASMPKLVDTQVYGADGDGGDFNSFEPTAAQKAFAEGLDNWNPETRASLMRQNAEEQGVTIPDTYFKTDNDK